MQEKTYPLREALLSCVVMLLTALLAITVLGIMAVIIVVFWR